MRRSLAWIPRSLAGPIALLGVLMLWPALAQSQPAPAGVVTSLQGQAALARPTIPQPIALKFKDAVFVRDRIETREDSIVRVLLGGKAMVTVRELTTFTVVEEPGRVIIELSRGRLALGVAKGHLQPGEAIEVRTPNAVAAVRGSALLVDTRVVGGVAESEFTALEATVPISVSLRATPATSVGLSARQAVSVLGLGPASALGPVRILTQIQMSVAVRARQAPRPKEQTDRPPDRIARRVSADKTREAVQLSDTLSGERALGGEILNTAGVTELSSLDRTYQRTQSLLELTSLAIDREFDRTRQAIEEEFNATVFNPEFTVNSTRIPLGVGEPLIEYRANFVNSFSPVVFLLDSQVVQPNPVSILRVNPGVTVSLRNTLVEAINTEFTTPSRFLYLDQGARLSAGRGGLGLLSFSDSTVTTGLQFVRLETGAELTLEAPLLSTLRTTFVAGADQTATSSFIFLGPQSQVSTTTGLALVGISASSSVSASGSFLALAEGAQVSSIGGGGFGLVRLGDSSVTTGGGLITLDTNARVTLNHPLLTSLDSTLTTNTRDQWAVVGLGPGARVDASTQLNVVTLSGGRLTTGGSFFAMDEGAILTTLDSSLPILGLLHMTAIIGQDVITLGAGSRIEAQDRPLLIVLDATVAAGGSILSIDRGATINTPASSLLGYLTFTDHSGVGAVGDFILLRPGAQVALERPLIFAQDSLLRSNGRLLFLDADASVTSTELIERAFLRLLTSSVQTGGDLVALGRGARLSLNRPLLFGNGTDFTVGGHVLSLGDSSQLVDGVGVLGLGLFEIAFGSIQAGGALLAVGPGSTARLSGPLLDGAGTALTLPAGLVRVSAGGRLVVTGSTDSLVWLSGGRHSIGTGAGAAMFDLAGSTTGQDAETGLTLGTSRPLQHAGALLETLGGAEVNGGAGVRIDTALLEASAPLFRLREASVVHTAGSALDLSLRAKVTSLGPLFKLDGSALTIERGGLVSLAGGSVLRVTGDLVELANQSSLTLLSGPLLSASGGSVVNISGAAVAFSGTGGNRVSIANSLCPCSLVAGVPVAFRDGALPGSVVIGPNPVRNPGLGTVTLGTGAAAIVVSGPTSRITIASP